MALLEEQLLILKAIISVERINKEHVANIQKNKSFESFLF